MALNQSIPVDFEIRNMNEYTEAAKRTEPDYGPVVERLANPRMARLLHVAMGLVTESAEFLDQLKKHLYYGKPLDTVNLSEELGDITWYQRLGADELETTLLAILDQNVAKLRARFPQKFEEAQALTRDLDAERRVLEGASDEPPTCPICDRAFYFGNCAGCGYVARRNGSGPLPGRDVTVVQTGEKTHFISKPSPADGYGYGYKDGHVNCPCWKTGRYAWVFGCLAHPKNFSE